MQHLDMPIDNCDNDKLNFKPFAKKVAKGILNYNQDETLISPTNKLILVFNLLVGLTKSLSQELKIFMFVNDENFFKIIEKIEYWQGSSFDKKYLIKKIF
jgi:hypothetical protein